MTSLCCVGSWHLASVMAGCFADAGHRVWGVDEDAAAISSLQKGAPAVYEPKLGRMLQRNLKSGRLRYTTDFRQAMEDAQLVCLAMDTPITPRGVDLGPIWDGVRKIAASARRDYILVVSSQVPVGTCEEIERVAAEANVEVRCEVACNPEFLRLGSAVDLFRRADRIVIGARKREVADKVAAVYAPFRRPILLMSLREAEMVKHATNAYVANSVSFMGEISQLCDELGVDSFQVSKALRLDRRVGPHAYVRPGLGFNGGTVARDVRVLMRTAESLGKRAPLLEAILEVNRRQNLVILERLRGIFGSLSGLQVALLGLTYKAKTSTLRGSLALQIATRVAAEGVSVRAYDPMVKGDALGPGAGIRLCGSVEEVATGSDALVVMTDKEEFVGLDLGPVGSVMRNRVLVDAANLYDPADATRLGFTYVAIGRGFTWIEGVPGDSEGPGTI